MDSLQYPLDGYADKTNPMNFFPSSILIGVYPAFICA